MLSQHKSFIKNLFWLQFLNWLIKPIWILLIEREVQLQLGDLGYGEYAVHLNLGTLFAVLLDAGINTYISREISVKGKLWDLKRILYLRLGLGGAYVAAVFLFAFFQGQISYSILLMVVVNQLLAASTLLFRAILQGKHKFVWDSILSVTDRFVAIFTLIFVFGLLGDGLQVQSKKIETIGVEAVNTGVTNSAFANSEISQSSTLVSSKIVANGSTEDSHSDSLAILKATGDQITHKNALLESSIIKFLLAQMAGYLVAVLLAIVFVWRSKNTNDTIEEIGPNEFQPWLSLTDWLKQMGWYVAMGLAMSAFTRLDVQMLQWFTTDVAKDPSFHGAIPATAGFTENGLYAKGFRLLDAALIFSSMLSVQLLPMFSRKYAIKESLQDLVWLSFRIVLVVGMIAVFVAYFYGKDLMQLFYHLQFDAEAHNVGMLFFGFMLAFMAMSSVHVFGTLLTAMGEVKWLTGLAFISLILNILVNFLQIPQLGAFGAVEACISTQWFFAIACIWRANKRKGFDWTWKQWEFLIFTILIFASVFTVMKLGFPYSDLLIALPMTILIALFPTILIGFSQEIKAVKSRIFGR